MAEDREPNVIERMVAAYRHESTLAFVEWGSTDPRIEPRAMLAAVRELRAILRDHDRISAVKDLRDIIEDHERRSEGK